MTNRKPTAALIAGLIAGGAAGFAFGIPALTSAAPIAVQQADDTTNDTVVNAEARGPHGPRGGGHGPAPEVLAELLGLDSDALRAEFEAGRSVAEIADAQGIDTQTVVDGLVANLESHLDEHVANGSLTQEEADAKAADAESMIAERITEVPELGGQRGESGHEGRGPGGKGISDEVLSVLGIDLETLRTEFAAGRSLADVATANGVEVQTVVDAMVAEAEVHLAEHVADGSLSQDEADAKAADLESSITERVNSVPPAPGEMDGRRGPGGRDGRGGRGHHDGPGAPEAVDA